MKIVQVASSIFPIDVGGVETHTYELSKSLVGRGHSVKIITKDGKYSFNQNKELLFIKLSTQQKMNYLLKEDFDILHIQGIVPYGIIPQLNHFESEIISLISKLRKKKIVCSPHGLIDALIMKGGFLRRSYSSFLRITLFKFVDKFVGVYPQQTEILMNAKIPKNKVIFIPNGISEKAFDCYNAKLFIRKYNLNDKKIIGYIGRLALVKRISDLIYVMSEICKIHADVVAVIIGPDGGDLPNLLNLVKKLNLNKNVLFLRKVSENEKYQALSSADIFVSPSSYEAFGLSTCEAMAQGVPVISANNPGAKYLLENGKYGYLYEIGNREELLEKVLFLLDNPSIAKKLGKKGQKRAKEFNWEKVAKNIESVYANLLS